MALARRTKDREPVCPIHKTPTGNELEGGRGRPTEIRQARSRLAGGRTVLVQRKDTFHATALWVGASKKEEVKGVKKHVRGTARA